MKNSEAAENVPMNFVSHTIQGYVNTLLLSCFMIAESQRVFFFVLFFKELNDSD